MRLDDPADVKFEFTHIMNEFVFSLLEEPQG